MTEGNLLCDNGVHLYAPSGHLVWKDNGATCPATYGKNVTVTWTGGITLYITPTTTNYFTDLGETCTLNAVFSSACGWYKYGGPGGRVYPLIDCMRFAPVGLPKYWAVSFAVSITGFYGIVRFVGADYYHGSYGTCLGWLAVSNAGGYTYSHSLANVAVSLIL